MSELRRAFEQMRVSLQARMQDLSRLLAASQGVASSLTLAGALQPVLEAIVAHGASSARIILLREMLPTPVETPVKFADGVEQDVYMHLDQQVLALAEEQERLVMATLSRTRGLVLDPNLPYPESLIALALRHENRYYGVLWAGVQQAARLFRSGSALYHHAGKSGLPGCREHPFVPHGRIKSPPVGSDP